MNPFLENDDSWQDFHNKFVVEIRDRLAAGVGQRYVVKLEMHIFLHELSSQERLLLGRADVGVSQSPWQAGTEVGSGVLHAPVMAQIPPAVDGEKLNFIEVRDKKDRRLITVVEVLSPTNKKPGPDRDLFVAKRRELLYQSVNYVEVDLLRGGPRMPMPEVPLCDYCVLVHKAAHWPDVGLWPTSLREKLPVIPIPLLEPDPDLMLDLQESFQVVFEEGHYSGYIYENTPQPPLSTEDQEWCKELMKNAM